MMMSAGLMIGGSLVTTVATILNAFIINKQFYPAIVYLSKSNASMAVIYFQIVVVLYLIFRLARYILFGELRASEVEHLSERTWHTILESCLAFTMFREEFSAIFVLQFVILLFIKCFHWLADDRVDMMERSPVITIKFHVRMLSVIGFLAGLDSFLVSHAYFTTLNKGASTQIVFGFEYAILATLVIHTAMKYLLHVSDMRNANSWDNKAFYLLIAELCISLSRCILYGAFFIVMLRVHTYPLYLVRPLYNSLRTLHKAFTDVILSRRAINAMNTQFPVVTADELAAMDATCIICREEMTADTSPKRLPCSHVFHTHCLRNWFQRQQTCPTCRTEIWGQRNNNNNNNNNNNINNNGNAAPGQQQPNVFQPPNFQFGGMFGAAQIPQQGGPNGPFPHQIFYAPPPPNRPEFMNVPPTGGAQLPHPPPPPPPFMFRTPPPPFEMPARPEYSGFSDEELRAMEGNSREAVIARLRALDDIMTLLDAAQIQMGLLEQLAPMRSTIPVQRTTQDQQNEGTQEQTTNSAGSEEEMNLPANEGSSTMTEDQPNNSSSRSLFQRDKELTSAPSTPKSTTSSMENNSRTPEMEEIRQRRLARFERSTESQPPPQE